jgi:pimeloyl-ACP methyl ester carboxylesterase
MKNRLKKIFIVVIIFIAFVLLILRYYSPQEAAPFKDKIGNLLENSISEIINLDINGVSQRLLIRGKNKSNPVLLHIHGGPGSPDYPFMEKGNFVLDDLFTVCYWEQRGTGGSYSDDIPKETMTLEQIVNDGIEVTKYLRNKFVKEKIYIQGHSWGTAVATSIIDKSPELFNAYFGIGQMVNSKLSEQLSYDFTMQSAEKYNDHKTIKKLKKIGRPPYKTNKEWLDKLMTERGLMKKYQDSLINKKESLFDIYKAFVFYKGYSITDKLNALKGDSFSMKQLWHEAVAINLFKNIPKYKIPVYFFQGKHDHTTVSSIVKKYYDFIEAPKKQYFEFENSAHSPQLEEFKKYKSIIEKIIKKKKNNDGEEKF